MEATTRKSATTKIPLLKSSSTQRRPTSALTSRAESATSRLTTPKVAARVVVSRSVRRGPSLESLPSDTLNLILMHLTQRDRFRLREVSKTLKALIEEHTMQLHFVQRKGDGIWERLIEPFWQLRDLRLIRTDVRDKDFRAWCSKLPKTQRAESKADAADMLPASGSFDLLLSELF